jgi:hypothetical protein
MIHFLSRYLKSLRFSVLILFLFLINAQLLAEKPKGKPYRFIYNCDADNMFYYKQPPMSAEDLHGYVDEVARANVTSFFICPNYGMVMNFDSETCEMVGDGVSKAHLKLVRETGAVKERTTERSALNMISFAESGQDPIRIILKRAKEKGMEAFITFRLNECHCVDTPNKFPLSLIISNYWRKHPEYHIGKPYDPLGKIHKEILGPNVHPIVAGWLPGGFNFANPEIRKRKLAQLRECCERYDLDGLEIDFQRFPMFFKVGEEKRNLDVMTEWMRDVRKMTREVSKKKNHPILLTIRAMAKPEQNPAIGLDVERWAKEGLIDFVVGSHYLRNDYNIPVSDYRKILPADMPFYASIEVENKPNRYRELATHLWSERVDGIMLFNYFTCRERGNEPDFELVKELTAPETIKSFLPKGQKK